MALIKSALELALEKTQGLTVDKEELRRKELFNQGRVAAAKGMEEGVDLLASIMADHSKKLSKDEYHIVAEGAMENLTSRILLQTDSYSHATQTRVGELLNQLTNKKSDHFVQNITTLLQQYATEFDQLKQAIAQQLGPQLRARAQQSGANPANYVMEKDPAYLKVLSENLEPMRAEYQTGLDQLKDQLRGLL